MSRNGRSNSTSSPSRPSSTSSPKQRPEISRNKTDFLERPHLHPHSRSRSTSQISELSLSSIDADITPTQNITKSCLSNTPEPIIPPTPQQQPAFTGSWDQQFFDQAFMSEIQGFEGGTVDFLYNVGAAGMFASPVHQSSNYSPSLSYSSKSSMDGILDNINIDPQLTNDFDDLFNTHIPFNGGNNLCLTMPPLDFSTSFYSRGGFFSS
jgi:hypothetical protein